MKIRHISIFILLFCAVTLGACAPQLSEQDIQGTVQIVIALTALAQTNSAPTSTATSEAAVAPSETMAPTQTPAEPVVVYLDVFGDAQAQIQTRVIAPFILYYRDIPDYPDLVSVTIQTVPDVPGYPYKAEAIFQTGITAGWLIGVQGGLVDWWLPECMGGCSFSADFRSTYPEIVGTMEP